MAARRPDCLPPADAGTGRGMPGGVEAGADAPSGSRWRSGLNSRNAVLVVAVLAIQLGFIASYLAAFHNPKPHAVPIAVVAPPGTPPEAATQAAALLNAIPGEPLDAHVVPDEAAARRQISDRTVYGAYLPATDGPDRLFVDSAASASVSQALGVVFGQIEGARQRPLTVQDVIPAGTGDARGLSAFYLAVGWMLGGYLVATALSISRSSRPEHPPAAVQRLGALALYSAVSGIAGAVITIGILGSFHRHLMALSLLGTLLVFASGAFAMALQAWTGTVGVGLTVVILVVLGNPSAGGAYAWPLLPPFWRAIGPWLPPGAGTTAIRGIVYFHRAGLAQPVLVLVAYAVGGSIATLGAALLADRRRRGGATASRPSTTH
jgi:hypothetical protein